jgi:hypothetical protein
MAELDEARIKAIIAELDQGISKEQAIAKIKTEFKFHTELIVGNKQGLLRIGVESLKAAFEPNSKFGCLDLDLSYLHQEPASRIAFIRNEKLKEELNQALKRMEEAQKRDYKQSPLEKLVGVLFVLFLGLLIPLAGIGVWTSIKWIAHFFN